MFDYLEAFGEGSRELIICETREEPVVGQLSRISSKLRR
jgi:hypothetical protein